MYFDVFLLMIRPPPRATRPYTRFPDTTLFRSGAYPVARGVAPITTAILGGALLGDSLTVASLLGIALVSGGILLVALGRSIAVAGLIAAGIAGLLTTRSEEHTSELQSLMRISYAVFCLKKKKQNYDT